MPGATQNVDSGVVNDPYELRIETIMLVKEANLATKNVDILTLFNSDIEKLHGLDKVTPNHNIGVNIKDWFLQGLTYQLVPNDKLAYVSDENLTIYVNRNQSDAWFYDETTGEICIICDPYTTDEVAVKFEKLNDVSVTEQMLQATQANNGIGQAYSLEDYDEISSALDELFGGGSNNVNPFLHCLHYEEEMPQIGEWQKLGFTTSAVPLDKNGEVVGSITSIGTGATESIPDNLDDIIEQWSKKQQKVNFLKK